MKLAILFAILFNTALFSQSKSSIPPKSTSPYPLIFMFDGQKIEGDSCKYLFHIGWFEWVLEVYRGDEGTTAIIKQLKTFSIRTKKEGE